MGNPKNGITRPKLKARKKYLVVGILESIFMNDISESSLFYWSLTGISPPTVFSSQVISLITHFAQCAGCVMEQGDIGETIHFSILPCYTICGVYIISC